MPIKPLPAERPKKQYTGIKSLAERKAELIKPKGIPDSEKSEKLRAYDERQRKERDRLKYAIDGDIFITLSFKNKNALAEFCKQFGLPELAPHEMVWHGDLPQLPTDATPRKRIPKNLFGWHTVGNVKTNPSPLNLDIFAAPGARSVEDFWTAYWAKAEELLRQPRDHFSVLDSEVWFAIVFDSGEQRTKWMNTHRLGHYAKDKREGNYLDGHEVQRLWSEA